MTRDRLALVGMVRHGQRRNPIDRIDPTHFWVVYSILWAAVLAMIGVLS